MLYQPQLFPLKSHELSAWSCSCCIVKFLTPSIQQPSLRWAMVLVSKVVPKLFWNWKMIGECINWESLFHHQFGLSIHTHHVYPFRTWIVYNPAPIPTSFTWKNPSQADRPSLLHHQRALDFDDPTLSCAQCPGEAPRSVLPRTAAWTAAMWSRGWNGEQTEAENGWIWMGEYGLVWFEVLKIVEKCYQVISTGMVGYGLVLKIGGKNTSIH